jgi:CO/xanthine dehydrogenase Mo-binding subunit
MGSVNNLQAPGFYSSGELAGMKLPLQQTVSAGSGGALAYYVVPNSRGQGTSVQYTRSAWMRGPGQAATTWGNEQIVDDLAHAANMDPIAFRKLNFDTSLTSQRVSALLDAVAVEAKWDARPAASKLGKGDIVTGQGLAVSGFAGTNVATVAHIQLNTKTGKINVKSLYTVGDAGFQYNPASIENQFQGCMVQFLSRCMHEQVTFSREHVTSLDWVSYPILRFKDVPPIVSVKILQRDDLPDTGVGEAGGQAVPAAVANAFFDATGIRIRTVPMTPARVRAVLANGGEAPAGYPSTAKV